MLLISNKEDMGYHPVIKYIPESIRGYLYSVNLSRAEEIRLRRGRVVTVFKESHSLFLTKDAKLSESTENGVIATSKDMDEAFELICKSSLYALEESIKNGYITVANGSRVGICGSATTRDTKITSIENISGLNYRLAREILGVSDSIIDNIIYDKKILNTLIISPPGCGKTTILRDIARNLSKRRYKVSIADERNEISATCNGQPGYELGNNCDVMEGAKKSEMMSILIRTMSPHVIITDELGDGEDIKVVKKAITSGVGVISSVHAKNRFEIKKTNPSLYESFQCFVTLSNKKGVGTVEEIYRDI